MNDKIEQEITINAPINTVWKVVTNPSQWFGDKAELDLKEGGKGTVSWEQFGDCPLEVIKMEQPNYFSFAWIAPDKETRSVGQQTLVEFNLSEEDGVTKLLLTESGYGDQLFGEEQKKSLFAKHISGWGHFTKQIKKHAEEL
jgi:uncharacterized protein YndB with AHSA1/START domain